MELFFIDFAGKTKAGKRIGKYICFCGKEFTAVIAAIKSGNTKSCGCLQKKHQQEFINKYKQNKHNHASGGKTSPTYQSWRAMHQRCSCPNNKDYKNYGGRGISVCTEWSSFIWFIEDMGLRPSTEYSLDRIDPDKDYCPSNCQWILKAENSRKGNAQRARKRGML